MTRRSIRRVPPELRIYGGKIFYDGGGVQIVDIKRSRFRTNLLVQHILCTVIKILVENRNIYYRLEYKSFVLILVRHKVNVVENLAFGPFMDE